MSSSHAVRIAVEELYREIPQAPPCVSDGKVVRGELIAETECHDGYEGAMASVKVFYVDGKILAEHLFGVFTLGSEADAKSAAWRIVNSPEYRNLLCNRFFRA